MPARLSGGTAYSRKQRNQSTIVIQRRNVVRKKKQMKTPGNEESTKGIMMSGDSPTPHTELLFELKETRINSPINAKCMQDKAVQFSADHVDETPNSGLAHQTLAVQEMNHNYERQAPPPSRPTSYRKSLENEEAIEHIEEIATTSNVDTRPLNDEGEASLSKDQLDGMCLAEPEPKPDDSCGVQCLYYTIQCCDCTIL